jgi:hypothetical protein
VDARLEDPDRELLATVALSGETNDDVFSLESGLRCLDSLRTLDRKSELLSLKARLQQAEREGDMKEAQRLLGEWNAKRKAQA